MDPIQAINVLSQVVKTARLPYNEHVVLERCVDILTQSIQSKSDSGTIQGESAPVTFEEPEPVADVVTSSAPTTTGKSRARARKRGK